MKSSFNLNDHIANIKISERTSCPAMQKSNINIINYNHVIINNILNTI